VIGLIVALSVAEGAVGRAAPDVPSCSVAAQELWDKLALSAMAMEPEGARKSVYERATEASRRCPTDERLAYLRLRAAELGAGSLMSHDANEAEHRRLARELAAQFPRSVRIATIAARYEGTVDLARKAVALDASYPPAQVALASALLADGDPVAAQRAIERVTDLATTDDGFAVLARIQWAQGDLAGATEMAKRQLRGRDPVGLEPGGGTARGMYRAHEVLGLAYLKQAQLELAAPHLIAAEPESKRVQELLRTATPALRRAVARARRAQHP
jgi:hypothetical protein